MHEWALAEAVIKTIKDHPNVKQIEKVTVKIGELQQIDMEIFSFAISELKKEYSLDNIEIVLKTEPALLKCRVCGKTWYFSENLKHLDDFIAESIHFVPEAFHAFIRCPHCGSPDIEIVKGRGVWIDEIKFRGE